MPLLWEMSIPNISKELNVTIRRIQYCLEKYNIEPIYNSIKF